MGVPGIDRCLLVLEVVSAVLSLEEQKQITGKNKNNRGAKVVSMLARRRATSTSVALAA